MGKALEHLSPEKRKEIAESLFQVTEVKKDEVRGLCPFHDEKNSSYGYNYVKDLGGCFTCGKRSQGDLVMLYTQVKGLSQKEGYMAFMDEYVMKEAPVVVKNGDDLEYSLSKLPPLSPSWIKKFKEKRGWSEDIIKSLDLRLQTYFRHPKTSKLIEIKDPNKIAIPVRDEKGVLKNIKVYAPKPKPGEEKFKIMPWKANLGTSLFPSPQEVDKSELIWICEGEPDCICARSHGLNAISQTHGVNNWSKEFTKQLKGCDVVIAYDDDIPGFEGAEMVAEKLVKSVKSVRMIRWPDFMHDYKKKLPDKHGNDLTDFFMKFGKSVSDLEDLLSEARHFEVHEMHESTRRFFNGKSFKPARLAKEIMSNISLVSEPATGLLYRWNFKYWETYDPQHLRKQAHNLLGEETRTSFVSDAVTQVQDRSTLDFGVEMDDNEDIVCLGNGMFDLKTFELKSHDKKYYSSYALDVIYDRNAACERWIRFLKETIQDEDTIKVVQEFFGYCLTREVKHEKSLHLLGPGSDGKSTLLSILQAVVGVNNCAAINMESLEKEFHRATLYKKLLNTAAEVEGKAFESGWFKTIVSGDLITAAFKNKDVFEFKPFCKLAFAYNRFPKVLDNTDGLFRRILLIPFKKQFFGKDKDIDLVDKLMTELDGIFKWSLDGLQRLRDQGEFTEAKGVNETLRKYKKSNNPVMSFSDEICVTENEEDSMNPVSVSLEDLYLEYKKYCTRYGFHPLNSNHFGREIKSIHRCITNGRRTVNGKRLMFYNGIGLRV
ncbi:MAG: DNA primase [Deltaproteobacteria bacterium]|nr:DNA primase [Deltaproteobacteria bacterium]